jgi:WD40 repeat protein
MRRGNAPSQVLASIDLDLLGGGSTSLAFDGSGERLVVATPTGSIRIYDVRKRRLLASFFYEGQTYSVAFDDTDKYLLTTGTAGITEGGPQFDAAVWSVSDGRRIWRRRTGGIPEGFGMQPNSGPVVLALSTILPGGSLGISADPLFWQTRDLVRIGCERIQYRLTPEERELFVPDAGIAPCSR